MLNRLKSEQSLLLEELKKLLNPHTKKAYLVGGGVRDIILGKTPKDLDIEIYDIKPSKFNALALKWGAVGVGKSFFVYKWKDLDLSLPRTERKIAPTHQGFDVEFCNDEKKASSRRDFTMNALMLDIFSNQLKDFWGGIKDIENKTIRLIDEEKFSEDALRVLRGARFASQLGFVIEKNTLEVMNKINLKELSHQRIFWEFEKIFLSFYPEIGMLNLHKLGVFKKLFNLEIDFQKMFDICEKIRKFYPYKTNSLHEYIVLYIFTHELKLDLKSFLNALNTPKSYFKMLKAPYKLLPISDEELLNISLDLPLKNWVGICQKDLVKRAKDLHVYEKEFRGGVLVEDVINDGFSGADIKKELLRRRKLAIKAQCE